MLSLEDWPDPPSGPRPLPARPSLAPGELPAAVAAAIWRGTELGSPVANVIPTGWAELDQELPGGGWPCHAVTEVLQPQPSVCEWRLLAPALKAIAATGKTLLIVGPPRHPHWPGLRRMGLNEKRLVWIQAESPAQRLWTTEQLVKSHAFGALVSWLPQARQAQIRRIQICAQGCEGPVFLCRPAAAEHEASAAPLRVQVRVGLDWALFVHVLKRKGPTHEGLLALPSVPGGLEAILTPRLLKPSAMMAARHEHEVTPDAVGCPAARPPAIRPATAH